MDKLVLWIKETRPQFLCLSVVLAFLGTAIAWYYGSFNFGYALLAGFGLTLTHGSVNALNDYFDYKSGIDLNVRRTPFSGGSGLVPDGKLPLRDALWVGIITSLMALTIGIFFVIVDGWRLVPLLAAAALLMVFYTPLVLKTRWPEWSAGFGLGTLPILGLYFVQRGGYDWVVLIASAPSFILVHNLLLLNEFPDMEADKKGGRKTTPVVFGLEAAGKFFRIMTIAVYVWIVGCVIATLITGSVVMPVYCLIVLLTLPLAVKAMKGSKEYRDMSRLVPAMGSNVAFILTAQLLLGVGYILAKLFPMTF